MTTVTIPIVQQFPRLVVAQYVPETAVDLATDDLTLQIQTTMRAIRGVQVAMVCAGAPASGDTGRLRVGLCLHPTLDEIVEAARYRGLTYGVSASAKEGGAGYRWLANGGADDLWPTITDEDSLGQLQNGGIFECEFPTLLDGGTLRARFVNIDWRKGDLAAGLTMSRLTVFVHCAD